MSPEFVEAARLTYLVLAFLCAVGFTATLVFRWDVLLSGERILRAGIIVEHLVIMYGATVALRPPVLPPSAVAPLLCGAMALMVLGFVTWIVNDLIPGRRDMNRLTDR